MNRQADDSELTVEQLQRLDHCIAEGRKAWNERFDLSDPKFLERYLLGYSCIHAHFVYRAAELDAKNFCATFFSPDFSIAPAFGEQLEFVSLEIMPNDVHGVRNIGKTEDHQEQFMFINVVKSMKDGKRVVDGNRSMVRLQPLDDCLGASGNALYYSPANGIFIFLPRGADGKLNPESGRLMPFQDESPNQMIKPRSQMIDNFSAANCEFRRGIGWTKDTKNMLRSIIITVHPEIVAMTVNKSGDDLIEAIDVMVGPLNLRLTPVEWM
jgi:hypothetical protein